MSAPFVTTSRDTLAEALHKTGCPYTPEGVCPPCGDRADELLASGVVVTVESLAADEALIAAVAQRLNPLGSSWLTDAAITTDVLAALAVALGAKP